MPHAATIASTSPLARMAESGRLADYVDPSSVARSDLVDASRRYSRPLRIRICGRAGTGRDTLARALRERLSVDVTDPGGDDGDDAADLWLVLLTGVPRRDDQDQLARVPSDRTIVVLGKADTHGEPARAAAVAAGCADRIGMPVIPVSGLLACADLDDAEFAYLRRLSCAGAAMPPMTGQFLVGTIAGSSAPPDVGPFPDDERAMRAALLRRIDRHGIEFALSRLASGDPATADAAALNEALHVRSGIGQLVAPISERVEAVRFWRLVDLRTRLEVIAARGRDRAAIEHLLQYEAVG